MHDILGIKMKHGKVSLSYDVRPSFEAWVLPEGTVPESPVHDQTVEAIKLRLEAWAAGSNRTLRISRNLAVRWIESHPRTGVDPDVCVLDPPPPDLDQHGALFLWRPRCTAPTLCVEVVSANHPHKDYRDI